MAEKDAEATGGGSGTKEEATTSLEDSRRRYLPAKIAGIAVLSVGGLAVIAAVYVIFLTDRGAAVLVALRDPAYARGVITFLVTVGTIFIALIVTIAALTGIGEQYASERFKNAREIVTMLVGVLGTIVGFYFGTASQASGADGAAESPVVSDRLLVVQAASYQLLAFVTGGRAPYSYSITFDPPAVDAITDRITDGWVSETIALGPEQTVHYTLLVADSAGEGLTVEGEITAVGSE